MLGCKVPTEDLFAQSIEHFQHPPPRWASDLLTMHEGWFVQEKGAASCSFSSAPFTLSLHNISDYSGQELWPLSSVISPICGFI